MANGKQKEIGQRNFWPGMMIPILFFIVNCPIYPAAKHALLIGIDDYKISGLENLKGAENDLGLITDILRNNLGFNEQEITILKNENATHSLLEKAFSRLTNSVNNGDFVYIHYCGHGSLTPDNNGDEYPGLYDQTWVPYGSRSNCMKGKDCYDITDDELHQWLLPLFNKTGHVVIVSDSCYSAGVTRGNVLPARSVLPDQRHYPSFEKILVNKDFDNGILISAAQDDELAFEAIFDGKIHGLFSWYWLDALKKSRPGDTWSDLFQRTYILVSNYFDQQHPQFQGDADKPVFGYNIKKNRPRIPISKVWPDGQKVRIEAGSLSGLCVGSKYRLYSPLENVTGLPLLEITKVTSFYSIAAAKEPFDFKVGDLVIEESNIHNNRFKRITPTRSFNINLSITLWQPVEKPEQSDDVCLELPDNKERFKKQAVFNPSEIEKRQIPVGNLLTFQVKNNSQRDCYIYLLDLMDNNGAEAIFPLPGDSRQKALLPAGGEVDLKNIVLLLLDCSGKKTIKLIATEAPINMALLAQKTLMMDGRGLKKDWGTIQFSITIDKKT